MKFSVIITNLNDHAECLATIQSVVEHSTDDTEIIVVDDYSPQPFAAPFGIKLIRNKHRCGVGPSRHIGVLAARNDVVLLLDSHMRIACDLNVALERLQGMQHTVMCGVCLGLDQKNMDVEKPNGVYHGATINVLGLDPNSKQKRMQVFEANWHRYGALADDQPIPCVMGACYAFQRQWFLHIDPLQHLRQWGEDEIMLSVKSWLAGGNVLLNTRLRVGHKFRLPSQKVPYPLGLTEKLYNKLFAMNTLLDPALIAAMMQHLRKNPDCGKALKLMEANWREVAIERERNFGIFSRDFRSLADQFRLHIP